MGAPRQGETVRLRTGALHWRHVEDQVVAIDVASREYFAINRTGACIWPALAAGATTEELAARLVERFRVDEEDATRDVDALLADLRDRGLLEA